MIDPSPTAISGQVVPEGPTSGSTSSLASDTRAPQALATTPLLEPSPASSPGRSPHEIQLTAEPDSNTRPTVSGAFIPPPAESMGCVEQEHLRSSPQVYPGHSNPGYYQNGIHDPSTAGYHYGSTSAYQHYQQPYPQPHPHPYPQPCPQPTDPSLAPSTQYNHQPYPQATPHLPLDFIPLPVAPEPTLATPVATQPSSSPGHVPSVSHHTQPYPAPSTVHPTPAPALHGTTNIDWPTPVMIAKERSRRRRWMILTVLLICIIAVVLGVVVPKKNNKEDDQKEKSDDATGGKPPGGTSSRTIPKPTTTGNPTAASSTTPPSPSATGSPPSQPKPTQSPPDVPRPKPSPEDPFGPAFDCRMDCVSAFWDCRRGCEGDSSYNQCKSGCSGDSTCEFHCRLDSSCYQGCDTGKTTCTNSCG